MDTVAVWPTSFGVKGQGYRLRFVLLKGTWSFWARVNMVIVLHRLSLNSWQCFLLFAADKLVSFVDGILQGRNGLFRHDLQWNALCRAYDLRHSAGEQCAFVPAELFLLAGAVVKLSKKNEISDLSNWKNQAVAKLRHGSLLPHVCSVWVYAVTHRVILTIVLADR